jgi:ferric-dicitrate binding protein FerR (iron transport regulator)
MLRKSPNMSPELAKVQRERAELDAEIARMKQMPDIIMKQDEEHKNTLPPTDMITARMRELERDYLATRTEIINMKRDAARHLWVMLALILALAAMLWWAYQSMQRHGIL